MPEYRLCAYMMSDTVKREASEEMRRAERDEGGGKDSLLFSLSVIYFPLFFFLLATPHLLRLPLITQLSGLSSKRV